jgi:hypothetical protein
MVCRLCEKLVNPATWLISIRAAVGFAKPSAGPSSAGKTTVSGLMVQGGQPDLLEIIGALDPVGRFADLLDGGQEEADQDRDDSHDHHQFHERKAGWFPGLVALVPTLGCLYPWGEPAARLPAPRYIRPHAR